MADVEVTEVQEFLTAHAPFDSLPAAEVRALVRRVAVRYARRGTRLMAVGRPNDEVFVVRSGAVEIADENGQVVERGDAGTTFGTTTVVGGNPSRFDVTAIEDSLLVVMSDSTFRELAAANPAVAEFFDEQRTRRLAEAVRSLHASARGHAVLQTRLRDLVRRAPVTAPLGTDVREAARIMTDAAVSCLLVMDGERLAGIVTDRDLRSRVLAAGVDPGTRVEQVMTAGPVTADPDSLALELVLEMTTRNIHHVPVVAAGVPVGVVTSTDLIRLESDHPIHLVGEIGKQDDVEGMARLRARLGEVVDAMVRQDATADAIGRIVTAVGDAITRRLITVAIKQIGPAPVPFCWVVLGSQARLEHTLSSDQDNALVISDEMLPEHETWFASLAGFVVDGLARCGYPLCTGDVMATNQAWRLTVSGWVEQFRTWLREPVPDAVVNSAIFFDMRAVHGESALVEQVQSRTLALAPDSRRFLGHMAASAVANEPPLGFFRGFVLQKRGEHKDELDLKHGGVNAIVELARVHALASGLPQVTTEARLSAAVGAGTLSQDRASDLADAFEYIRWTLLSRQAIQLPETGTASVYVSPDGLTPLERRHLRDSFQIIREAQQELAHRYSTSSIL